MKTLKWLLFATSFIIISCSNSSDDSPQNSSENYTFSIDQDIQNIQELDNVTFFIQNTNSANINSIAWYVNNTMVSNTSTNLQKTFLTFGSFTIKAVVNYYNSQNTLLTKTIEKQIQVSERPKNLVTIKKIEIVSFTDAYQFYVSLNGYYMKSKFDIRELDELDNPVIRLISTENSQNWGNSSSMTYPMSWDIISQNYQVKVYQSGNYYPNNQQYYHTDLTFYGAKSLVGVQQPFQQISNFKLDLNPYRSLHPTTINVSNLNMEIKLTLQWN
ncbi:MAG: hypothetical protein JNJ52_01745 [Flavobacterium sp.]|nr:hypothetical protein [Flavobacterium sp.]